MEIISTQENKSYGIKFEAKEGDILLGWAYLYVMHNDLHEEPFGFLENVFVNEDYRGRGTGKKLIESVIAAAREHHCYKIVGTSRYERPEVHAMYEKIGFKDYGKEFRMNL
jgi:GNAT superfamily N-acetyltransferase